MKMQKTGDPEIDALFKAAKKEKKKTVEYAGISMERVKPEGEVQNSGIEAGDENTVLIPHMSAEETENNEPANGKGLVPIRVPDGTSRATFLTLLSNAYALYVTSGSYDNEDLQRRTGMAPGTVARVISSPEFKEALRIRGVHPNATGLTREQDLVLLSLTDPSDGKTLQQKLRSCNVSYATYRGWMKQPVFRMQMEAMTESTLSDNASALVQLEKLAGMGDLAAIKFKLELSGRYNPNAQQNIDVIAMMSIMMDIIVKNVRDQGALQAISTEFGQLATSLKITTPQIGA